MTIAVGRSVAAALVVCLFAGAASRAATPEEINKAIAKGVAYIYSQEKPGGHWETSVNRIGKEHNWQEMQGDSFGGFTSLATYALLSAGEDPQSPPVASAIQYLEKADIIGIYSLGLRAQVWHMLPVTPKNKALLQDLAARDAARIIAGVNTSGDNRGLWDYGDGKGMRIDHSVSQYGILGLWALEESGAHIDVRYWKTFDEVWRQQQYTDGGWAYDSTPTHAGDHPSEPTASMTAAGIATLFITEQYASADDPVSPGNSSKDAINNGLRWITKHFGEVGMPYAWYGVGRIGAASGTKYFGTTDWFQEGAKKLVAAQEPNGSWKVNGVGTDLTDTCFAVLFLARGRAPITMNKVQYDIAEKTGPPKEADWNQRPRDVANLTTWIGKQLETNLNWQAVNLQVTPEELRDAPILYLSGREPLDLPQEEMDKLRTVVYEGGMIVANANDNSAAFNASFQKLGSKLFPYEFRELEPNSPIYGEEAKLKHLRGKVLAMTNGIRELMILVADGDPSKSWQANTKARQDMFELGTNIFLYAVDKTNLQIKGQTNIVMPNPAIKANRTLRVARIQYDGNWDPEPGGWTRLAAILHNDYKLDLNLKTLRLGHGELSDVPGGTPTPHLTGEELHKAAFKRIPPDQVLATEGDQQKLNKLITAQEANINAEYQAAEARRLAALAPYKLAVLTGTGRLILSDPQIDELRKFAANGGTLVVDAGGGAGDFAVSAEALLKRIFPDSAAGGLTQPLPPESSLYSMPDAKITTFGYRSFARTLLGQLHSPRLCAIVDKGHVAAYFSREDLTGGLVGEPMDGIVGYDPPTATAIMRNIVLASAPVAPIAPRPTSAPSTPAKK